MGVGGNDGRRPNRATRPDLDLLPALESIRGGAPPRVDSGLFRLILSLIVGRRTPSGTRYLGFVRRCPLYGD